MGLFSLFKRKKGDPVPEEPVEVTAPEDETLLQDVMRLPPKLREATLLYY